MGPRVPFVSNPFGVISPNKVVKTNKTKTKQEKKKSCNTNGYEKMHAQPPKIPDIYEVL